MIWVAVMFFSYYITCSEQCHDQQMRYMRRGICPCIWLLFTMYSRITKVLKGVCSLAQETLNITSCICLSCFASGGLLLEQWQVAFKAQHFLVLSLCLTICYIVILSCFLNWNCPYSPGWYLCSHLLWIHSKCLQQNVCYAMELKAFAFCVCCPNLLQSAVGGVPFRYEANKSCPTLLLISGSVQADCLGYSSECATLPVF